MSANGLATRWASPPGETISGVLRGRGLTVEQVARDTGLSDRDFNALLVGDLQIDRTIAEALAVSLGASASFWLTREEQYREDLERVEADKWSEALPWKQMCEFGWTSEPRTWVERIEKGLTYFGVSSLASWDEQYAAQVEDAHYRTSAAFTLEVNSTAVWFRACELEATRNPVRYAFDAERFSAGLADMRRLTRIADPELFIPELTEACASLGVQLVVVRAPKGCTASGASRMYAGRPLISLSARHLSDDHFWFTFFHEAGHVVEGDLSTPYIDSDALVHDEYERAANEFAATHLLGEHQLSRPSSHRDLIRTAQMLGLAPGVLVGQLQNSGELRRNEYNSLKRRYAWHGTTLEKACKR